jgi:hypothetical protein
MEEHNCNYVSSLGIQKSCDIFMTNQIKNEIFEISNEKIIYVKTDIIYTFSKIINHIPNNFVLVTGDSDYTIPNDIFPNLQEFIHFIENKKIIKWYVQNSIYKHDKIINLPIGMDYHFLNNNDNFWWGPKMKPTEQEKELILIKNNNKPFYERIPLIYSNCHFQTNTKYGEDRINALNIIPNDLLSLEKERVNRKTTWNNQIRYSFVLSPHGNGLDCHRTWEAIILGCIPIVKKSNIDSLYDDLPVLIVNHWNEVTKELLNNTIISFKDKNFNFKKITLEYWMDLIRKHIN